MNWKKALGLFVAYKAGQGSRREAPPRETKSPPAGGVSKIGCLVEVAVGVIIAIVLIKLGV